MFTSYEDLHLAFGTSLFRRQPLGIHLEDTISRRHTCPLALSIFMSPLLGLSLSLPSVGVGLYMYQLGLEDLQSVVLSKSSASIRPSIHVTVIQGSASSIVNQQKEKY